jgi:hypothetical protein
LGPFETEGGGNAIKTQDSWIGDTIRFPSPAPETKPDGVGLSFSGFFMPPKNEETVKIAITFEIAHPASARVTWRCWCEICPH